MQPEKESSEVARQFSALRGPTVFLGTFSCWLIAIFAWCIAPPPEIDPQLIQQLNVIGRTYFSPDYDIPIYLLAGVVAVLVATTLSLRNGWNCRTGLKPEAIRPPQKSFQLLRYLDILVPALIVILVWSPTPSVIADQAFGKDGFHHVDAFVMGPLYAFRHGGALGTDVYSQYGCGWVLVYFFLGLFFTLDHYFFFATSPVFGSLYFVTVYAALRSCIGAPHWAMAGLMACLYLQMYCGTDVPIWTYPSSSILRCPLDMLLFITLLQIGRSKSLWNAFAAGIFAGATFLVGVDIAVYAMAGIGVVSVLLVVSYFRSRDSQLISVLALMWGTALTMVVIGLVIASRGTFLQPAFWYGYFEVFRLYPAGFSSLPLFKVIENPIHAFLFLSIIMTYSLTLGCVFARSITGQQRSSDLACSFLAVVGSGTLLIFINRSHPFNLFHPIVPACVLWAISAANFFQRRAFNAQARPFDVKDVAMGLLTSGLLLVALLFNENFWDYSSTIAVVARNFSDKKISPSRLVAAIQQVRKCGEEMKPYRKQSTFMLVGEDPILWQMTLDLPPVGRYCPSVPLTYAMEKTILDSITARFLVVTRVPTLYGNPIIDIVQRNYSLLELHDLYAVLQRNDDPVLENQTLPETRGNPVD